MGKYLFHQLQVKEFCLIELMINDLQERIPLILLHAGAAAMARGNQQLLDEQAAGLVAERAEQERRVVA